MSTSATALASEIAKREGKKTQVRIGDIREVLGILADIFVEDQGPAVINMLIRIGRTRAAARKKGK